MTSAAQDSFDKAAMHNRKVQNATRMLAEPDGRSLRCGNCGWWDYILPPRLAGIYNCPTCHHQHDWRPVSVCCANPTHGISMGCGSALCPNRRTGLL
jgi:hypothetical protein